MWTAEELLTQSLNHVIKADGWGWECAGGGKKRLWSNGQIDRTNLMTCNIELYILSPRHIWHPDDPHKS